MRSLTGRINNTPRKVLEFSTPFEALLLTFIKVVGLTLEFRVCAVSKTTVFAKLVQRPSSQLTRAARELWE
jgi:hypothetical protein